MALALRASCVAAAGPELIVVAALPPEHAGDVAEISAAASAVVAWRGEARPVLEAVSRVMAARDAPSVLGAGPAPRAGPHAPARAGRASVRPRRLPRPPRRPVRAR